MNGFLSALWAETLKARRSKVSLLTLIAVSMLPLADGLFAIILKNPERAREMGLLGAKAELAMGTADWPTFFYVLVIGAAAGGALLIAFIAAWVFGREFSDHTAKELLALPTPRATIVAAKLVLIGLWMLLLALWIFLLGLGVGLIVDIPGGSVGLAWQSFWILLLAATLNYLLMPWVALFASIGRGYLPPLGWAVLTLALAQLLTALGWADWFPWAVPALVGELAGPNGQPIALSSYVLVALTCILGVAATLAWWRSADQTR
jgi:ABC-2 type transport system permease protein